MRSGEFPPKPAEIEMGQPLEHWKVTECYEIVMAGAFRQMAVDLLVAGQMSKKTDRYRV